jgi:hypothetical protein
VVGSPPPPHPAPRPPRLGARRSCASGSPLRVRFWWGVRRAGPVVARLASTLRRPPGGHHARCARRGANRPSWRTWRRAGAGAIPDCGASQLGGAPGRPAAGSGRDHRGTSARAEHGAHRPGG